MYNSDINSAYKAFGCRLFLAFILGLHTFIYIYKVEGKAVPLQAWSDPDGSRKLRFPDFMTTAQEGG